MAVHYGYLIMVILLPVISQVITASAMKEDNRLIYQNRCPKDCTCDNYHVRCNSILDFSLSSLPADAKIVIFKENFPCDADVLKLMMLLRLAKARPLRIGLALIDLKQLDFYPKSPFESRGLRLRRATPKNLFMQAIILGTCFSGGLALVILICWRNRMKRKLLDRSEENSTINNTNGENNLQVFPSTPIACVYSDTSDRTQIGNSNAATSTDPLAQPEEFRNYESTSFNPEISKTAYKESEIANEPPPYHLILSSKCKAELVSEWDNKRIKGWKDMRLLAYFVIHLDVVLF
ncbi:uncharacterized protein TRIADDRAFT_59482 [Trichoplax adhaerens]|uniref:Uncharacterized protein n=1 Tax=Trichoplax adhaerens TaxID=10228 RepID=B3S5U8_TRIAD|nr:predicted protein [Trichoplax adhaerens]EDV21856.1 predicted protein [Trichoplax adhaerens]|eukprot:XP_002115493.1 predicted protein [Trichoplax adhaerens]